MNKDIELYGVVQIEENTWHMIGGDGEIIKTITKDTVVNYCKKECEDSDIECISAETIIDNVWWSLNDDSNIGLIDCFCQYWDKFLAWYRYVCVEYLAQEITAIYKQRLDDFE